MSKKQNVVWTSDTVLVIPLLRRYCVCRLRTGEPCQYDLALLLLWSIYSASCRTNMLRDSRLLSSGSFGYPM